MEIPDVHRLSKKEGDAILDAFCHAVTLCQMTGIQEFGRSMISWAEPYFAPLFLISMGGEVKLKIL